MLEALSPLAYLTPYFLAILVLMALPAVQVPRGDEEDEPRRR
jgi:hypothetical protein